MKLRIFLLVLESLLAPQFDPVFFNGEVFGAPRQAPPKMEPSPKAKVPLAPLPSHSQSENRALIEAYTKILSADPSDADAYVQRGLAKFYLRDYHAALLDYDTAVAEAPANGAAYEARSLLKWVLHAMATGDGNGALADYASALARDDQTIEPTLDAPEDFFAARAAHKFKIKDFWGATADWNKVILLKPETSSAYQERGRARRGALDYEGAMQDLQTALELCPERYWLFIELAEICLELRDEEGAISYYKRCLPAACDPQDLFSLAALEEKHRDYEGASAVYTKLIQEEFDTVRALLCRARINQKIGDLLAAQADVDAALTLDADSPQIHLLQGNLQTELSFFSEAKRSYEKVFQFSATDPSFLLPRAILKQRTGDIKGALDDMDQAVAIAPGDFLLYRQRAKILFREGDHSGALQDCLKSLALNPFEAETYILRAKLHLKDGELEGATICLKRALEVSPRCVNAAMHLWGLNIHGKSEVGAQSALTAIAKACEGTSPAWLFENRLALHIGGALPRMELMREIPVLQSVASGESQSDAFYFTGVKALADGEINVAVALLQQCQKLGQPDFFSVMIAGLILKTLE
jgi:serine/threonine-protein kinase